MRIAVCDCGTFFICLMSFRQNITRGKMVKLQNRIGKHCGQNNGATTCRAVSNIPLGPETKLSLPARKTELKKAYDDNLVVVGGPPCQAYSMAGRAANNKNEDYDETQDVRLSLYEEYMKVVGKLQPVVMLMENVPGMLSAKQEGQEIFPKVVERIDWYGYELYSMSPWASTKPYSSGVLRPHDFIVNAEEYMIPQKRSRVFLLAIRKDKAKTLNPGDVPKLQRNCYTVTIENIIDNMPKIRASLVREGSSYVAWTKTMHDVIATVRQSVETHKMLRPHREAFIQELDKMAKHVSMPEPKHCDTKETKPPHCPQVLWNWLVDSNLAKPSFHFTKLEIPKRLIWNLYGAIYAQIHWKSAKISDYPDSILGELLSYKRERRWETKVRVQVRNLPAHAIIASLYNNCAYTHYDMYQCRSLSIREAARLQTFPDNFYFYGKQRSSAKQVGNAVPPYLAYQIAQQIAQLIRNFQ